VAENSRGYEQDCQGGPESEGRLIFNNVIAYYDFPGIKSQQALLPGVINGVVVYCARGIVIDRIIFCSQQFRQWVAPVFDRI
jgi:hypothetical protein